ncbi:MAG TPA: phosphotransferase [Candidatus Limnocylindrales bacterium]|nr:phosphotransferase [Candidatus Limnocylindrales bacterium]
MKDLVPCEILTANLLEHAATRAWNELQIEPIEPFEIQTLKRKNKSAIYRLAGAGPNRSNVIAKRCFTSTAATEQMIYDQVLGCLPLPALRCYGLLRDASPEFTWLFVEDAGTQPYRAELPEHRTLFAKWLATLHTASQDSYAAYLLPDRGTGHYRAHLQAGRDRIRNYSDNPALTTEDRKLLADLIAQSDFLEANWEQIESICKPMPRALVHGDLKEKNLRVRRTQGVLALLCFDWETAGRGVLGPDLIKCAALPQYHAVAKAKWPDLQLKDLDTMFKIGVLFRTLAKMHWESSHLEFQWLERPRFTLNQCRDHLAQSMRHLGLHSKRVL